MLVFFFSTHSFEFPIKTFNTMLMFLKITGSLCIAFTTICAMLMFCKVACIFCIACSVICTMLMFCLLTDRILLCIIISFYIVCKFLVIPMISRKSLSLGIKFILIPCINLSRLIPLCVCLLTVRCNILCIIAVCICHRNHCGSEYHQSCKRHRYDLLKKTSCIHKQPPLCYPLKINFVLFHTNTIATIGHTAVTQKYFLSFFKKSCYQKQKHKHGKRMNIYL